jgi:hypothetical protein
MREQKMAWIQQEDIPDEYRWIRIRLYRDDLLQASDWRMVEDAIWDKAPWVTYRQTLRDLPTSNADPMKIVFPNEPA